MTSSNRQHEVVLAFLLAAVCSAPVKADTEYEAGGHVKGRVVADTYPSDSILHSQGGSSAAEAETDLRINFAADNGAWSLDSAWQIYAGHGDRISLFRALPGNAASFVDASVSDSRRLMNLTDIIRDSGKTRVLHRLDRLSLGFTSDNFVVRLGRQAITWGNGLVFSPMDIVNPFDPTAVDTEYKPGDDMLYAQVLLGGGDDLQIANVIRRNPVSGDVDRRAATISVKYHGILQNSEYDILLAEHYDETILGLGGTRSIGGAEWRGDVVLADTSGGATLQVVTNLSYSWVSGGRNMSGIVEYYFNGFGQHGDRYEAALIGQNQDLAQRLERGELFTIGRNYLAGGILVEMNPLWTLSPNVFANLDDRSALLQVTTQHNLGDNSNFIAAMNIPLGPSGTEFGGLAINQQGLYFSTDLSVFAQFAWYF